MYSSKPSFLYGSHRQNSVKRMKSLKRRFYFCCIFMIFTIFLFNLYYGNLLKTSLDRKWLDADGLPQDENTFEEENNATKTFQILAKVDYSSQFISTLTDDLTVVTAYFNIGKFGKGYTKTYTPDTYNEWLRVFGYISNPVVAFFDRVKTAQVFNELRANFPSNLTRVVLLRRNETRIFQLLPTISEIFNQPGYAKHHPNTIVPEYAAAVNAKYEIVQMAIDSNPFKTKYFCWLDIGYFRDLAKESSIFKLDRPLDFNDSSVAYGSVGKRYSVFTAREIIYANMNMVAGGIFLGRWDILRRLTVEYLNVFENLVKRKLVSADQQTIYIMINENSTKTNLQLYNSSRIEDWFYLGFKCKEAGALRAGLSNRYILTTSKTIT